MRAIEIPIYVQDPVFYRRFLNTWGGWNLDPDEVVLAIFIVLAIVSVVAGLVIYVKFIRKPEEYVSPGLISDPQDIIEKLDQAIVQRSKFEFGFQADVDQNPLARCTILDVGEQNFNIELPGYIQATPEWIKKTIYCFFNLKAKKGSLHPVFYYMSTTIEGLSSAGDDRTIVTLKIPAELEIKQKRRHLRLDVTPADIPFLHIWPVKFDKEHKIISDISLLGKPLFGSGEADLNNARAVNISASGIRVQVDNEALNELNMEVGKGKVFFVHFALTVPEEKTGLDLWTVSKVQNTFKEYMGKTTDLGMEFVGRGMPEANGDSVNIKWFKVTGEGIASLEDMIVRMHLNRYREKGLV